MKDSFTGLTILDINHLRLVNGNWPHVNTGHLEEMCPVQIKMKHKFTVNLRVLEWQN